MTKKSRIRCIACARRTTNAKVLRVGAERFGPLCRRCARKVAAAVGDHGINVVEGGSTPPDARLFNPPHSSGLATTIDTAEEHNVEAVLLWDFPEEDFPLWHELYCQEYASSADHVCRTYAEYQSVLSQHKADLEDHGIKAWCIRATVQEMMDACEEIGLPYSTRGRLAALRYLAFGAS